MKERDVRREGKEECEWAEDGWKGTVGRHCLRRDVLSGDTSACGLEGEWLRGTVTG